MFDPCMVFIGPWNPSNHGSVKTKRVTTEVELETALAEGWRRHPVPDVVEPVVPSDDSVPADDEQPETVEAELVTQVVAVPRRRGRPPKVQA